MEYTIFSDILGNNKPQSNSIVDWGLHDIRCLFTY